MNKEIKDRLDKLENELKESKDEIHSLKSSVSLKIERGIRNLLSRFTRRQIILGSVIVLLSISIIGIAGTVTKTYTFSSGDVVSASKINTNFDNLYTLVNGNLDDSNISGISGSKITSGTVAAARLDNLSGSKITSGTVAAARIDNLDGSKITSGTVAAARIDNLDGSKITSGTVAAARIDNLDGSKITSGTVAAARIDNLDASKITSGKVAAARIDNVSSTAINYEGVFIFSTYTGNTGHFASSPGLSGSNGNLGGRSGADTFCSNWKFKIPKNLNTCSNVRALISINSSDEVRDMPTNYSVPSDKPVFNESGQIIADNLTHLVSGNNLYNRLVVDTQNHSYWTGTSAGGALNSNNCNAFSSDSNAAKGQVHERDYYYFKLDELVCGSNGYLLCLCY